MIDIKVSLVSLWVFIATIKGVNILCLVKPTCCPVSTSGAVQLTGQLALRTVKT